MAGAALRFRVTVEGGWARTRWIAVVASGPSVVETDGDWLLASDLRRTVWIPLGQVVSVEQGWFPGQTRVHVELACDTPFGQQFAFEAPVELGALFGQHPVVEELRELVARAKATQSYPGSRAS